MKATGATLAAQKSDGHQPKDEDRTSSRRSNTVGTSATSPGPSPYWWAADKLLKQLWDFRT